MNPAFRLLLAPPEDAAQGEAGRSVAFALRDSEPSDSKEFLAAFRRAVHLEPNDPDYYYILGDALARLGRHREALPALREAIQMSPADATYHHALGATLWNLGCHEDASRALGEAARLRPDDLPTLCALGAVFVARGRHREAVRTLHRALRLQNGHAASHSNLGAALWGLGRRSDALRALQRAVQLEPAQPELRRNLAQALLTSGRTEEALASMRQALRLRSEDPEIQLDLAETLAACGRTAEAQGAFDEALRLDPGCLQRRPASREIHDAMRLAHLRTGLSPEAPGPFSLARNAAFALLFALGGALGRLAPVPSTLGAGLWYFCLAGTVYSAWLVGPPYFDYFLLRTGWPKSPARRSRATATCWRGCCTRCTSRVSTPTYMRTAARSRRGRNGG